MNYRIISHTFVRTDAVRGKRLMADQSRGTREQFFVEMKNEKDQTQKKFQCRSLHRNSAKSSLTFYFCKSNFSAGDHYLKVYRQWINNCEITITLLV